MFNGTITGRLTKDVEKRIYDQKTGAMLCSSSLAVVVGYDTKKNEKIVNFIDFVVFGKQQVEYFASYGKKGNGFILGGSMKIETYNKSDGTTGMNLKMEVKTYEMYDNILANELKRQQAQQNQNNGYNNGFNNQPQPQQEQKNPFEDINNGLTISDDDLPF